MCNRHSFAVTKAGRVIDGLGLTVDKKVFVPKASHDRAAEAPLRSLYPTLEAWEADDTIRWDALYLPYAERVHRAHDLALREDDINAFLPLSELATKGAYLYGVTDEGVCYVIREVAK